MYLITSLLTFYIYFPYSFYDLFHFTHCLGLRLIKGSGQRRVIFVSTYCIFKSDHLLKLLFVLLWLYFVENDKILDENNDVSQEKTDEPLSKKLCAEANGNLRYSLVSNFEI